LRGFLAERLAKSWSPEQIVHALHVRFLNQSECHLVAETIYQAVYARSSVGWIASSRGCCAPAEVVAGPERIPRRVGTVCCPT
jgi:hypothetical protein